MKITDNKKAIGIITAQEDRYWDCYPAIDYDEKNYMEVKRDVGNLIEKFKLGDCLIAKTGASNYHAFFFYEMLNWEDIIEILESSKLIDPKFLQMKKDTGQLRMRVAGKGKNPPRIVDIIKSPYPNMNTPMGEARKRHYGMLVKKLGRKHGKN